MGFILPSSFGVTRELFFAIFDWNDAQISYELSFLVFSNPHLYTFFIEKEALTDEILVRARGTWDDVMIDFPEVEVECNFRSWKRRKVSEVGGCSRSKKKSSLYFWHVKRWKVRDFHFSSFSPTFYTTPKHPLKFSIQKHSKSESSRFKW